MRTHDQWSRWLNRGSVAGFERARLVLEITADTAFVGPRMTIRAPLNPSMPSILDAMPEVLTDGERRRFEEYLCPKNGRAHRRRG